MSKPVALYCWHFMAYPHLPADFDEKYDTGWVTVPNKLWDAEKSRGLYQQYRPAHLCFGTGLRRDGAQRAPPEHLRLDALPQPDRRRALAENQARQDCHPRQSAAAAPEPPAHRRGIRDARQHVRWPAYRGLRAGVGPGNIQL